MRRRRQSQEVVTNLQGSSDTKQESSSFSRCVSHNSNKRDIKKGSKTERHLQRDKDERGRVGLSALSQTNGSVSISVHYSIYCRRCVCRRVCVPVTLPCIQCMTIILLQTVWAIKNTELLDSHSPGFGGQNFSRQQVRGAGVKGFPVVRKKLCEGR